MCVCPGEDSIHLLGLVCVWGVCVGGGGVGVCVCVCVARIGQYSLARAAITKCHRLGGFTDKNVFPQSWRLPVLD